MLPQRKHLAIPALTVRSICLRLHCCAEFVNTRGPEIDVPGQGQLFFPLLNYPEFDFTVVHPNTYPMVQRILGGEDKPRIIEFNCEPRRSLAHTPHRESRQRERADRDTETHRETSQSHADPSIQPRFDQALRVFF